MCKISLKIPVSSSVDVVSSAKSVVNSLVVVVVGAVVTVVVVGPTVQTTRYQISIKRGSVLFTSLCQGQRITRQGTGLTVKKMFKELKGKDPRPELHRTTLSPLSLPRGHTK